MAEVEEKPEDGGEDPYAKLQRDYMAEKKAREDAEATARNERAQREHLQTEHTQGNKALIEHALMSANAEIDLAKRTYAAAMVNQDWEAAAEAQKSIAEATFKQKQLEAGAAELERQQKQPPRQQTQQEPSFEQKLTAFSPKTQRWLREHREVLDDPRKWSLAANYHNIATQQHGLDPESDDYFAFIEDSMGYGQETAPRQRETTRQRPQAAPPSRQGNPRQAPTRQSVKLSPSEREHAASMGMTEEDYAAGKLAIMNGKSNLRYSSDLKGGNSGYDT
jgi:hypothetical protein